MLQRLALNGVAALVVDPIDQGERIQLVVDSSVRLYPCASRKTLRTRMGTRGYQD